MRWACAAPVEQRLGGRALDARAHRIFVVLDRVDHRQVPQLGHVEGLVDLALVDRAVAEIGQAHPAVLGIFMLEREAGAERHLRADDAVPAVKAVVDAEHVHRPALAVGDARLAPRQLGHDHLGVDAVGEHVAMVAIAGDDAVLADRHRALEPDRDRFLADVEVAEAADQPEPVELPRPLLEAADEQHLAIELHHLVLGRLVALAAAADARFRLPARRAEAAAFFAVRATAISLLTEARQPIGGACASGNPSALLGRA